MVSPLDRKLLRDLWRMKWQAAAIGAVIAVGVMMLVMMTGLVASLTETRDAYYDRYRLADVFAPVARAPERLAKTLGEIDGVSAVRTRITGRALIDMPSQTLPVQAQALSLGMTGQLTQGPAALDRDQGIGRSLLNDIYLTDGRLPDPGRMDEVVVLQSFAMAHNIGPGDHLAATMNGTRRSFTIVGLAQSPEFLYVTAPGELVPDDARFAVIWMSRPALAAAYDLNGAFNEVLMALSRDATERDVLDQVDRILSPYGGVGAYGRADQASNRFVSEEIGGLRSASGFAPPIFLAVAAFLLYIVITRMVQSEREEIGLMKAFGYSNAEVGLHYFKLVLAIAIGGAFVGCLGGIATGRAMIGLYTTYFKFPFLVFRLDPASFVTGVSVSVLSASAGGLFVLRRVFALTPATAMRPPAPADYSRPGAISKAIAQHLDQPSRMVLRRLTRQPVRMIGAMIGIAFGMGMSLAMIIIYAGFDRAVDQSFSLIDRSDLMVSFAGPASAKTMFELRRIHGVHHVEPVRHVPVILSNGRHVHRGAVTGLPRDAVLNRALDADAQPITMPASGVVLSQALANTLHIRAGDTITLDVREGRQPVIVIPVVGVAQTLLGAPAFMDLDALNRALRQPGYVSGAYVTIDSAQSDAIFQTLQDRPRIAGLSLKSQARDALVTLMNSGTGTMRYVLSGFAFIIAFGIIYNAARIALSERARDLASLRVMGFSRAEVSFVLLGELAVVTLIALPVGSAIGYALAFGIAAGFSTELYQIPVVFSPASLGGAIIVVLLASVVSGWLVKRDLDRSDMIGALKTRE